MEPDTGGVLARLRSAARVSATRDDAASRDDEPISTRDVAALIWRARQQGALLHLTADSRPAMWPTPIWNGLLAYRRSQALHRLGIEAEVIRISSRLRAAGVDAVLCSAWALARAHYRHEDRREISSTTQWIVSPGQRAAAVACLEACGYGVGPVDRLALREANHTRMTVDEMHLPPEATSEIAVGTGRLRVPAAGLWLALLTRRWAGVRLSLEHAVDVVSVLRAFGSNDVRWFTDALAHERGRPVPEVVDDACTQLDQQCPDWLVASRRITSRPLRMEDRVATGDVASPRPASLGRYAGSPPAVVARMLDAAGVGPSDVVFDLGCGDARIAIAAASLGARAVAVDNDPDQIAAARSALAASPVADRVVIQHGDVRSIDLSGATVVCLYLQGFAYGEIAPWLRAHLRAGSRVVTHDYGFLDRVPTVVDIVAVDDARTAFVYVWAL